MNKEALLKQITDFLNENQETVRRVFIWWPIFIASGCVVIALFCIVMYEMFENPWLFWVPFLVLIFGGLGSLLWELFGFEKPWRKRR